MADRPPSLPGPMPSSFDENPDFRNERTMQKVGRKLREEPLVPLGIGLTVFAFVNAYRALRRGDSRQANRMFRARVAAQGFTVIAMVAGSMYYSKDREKTKELRHLKEERDAEEKRQRWIRELEARDDEEKALKARLQQRRKGGPSATATTAAAEPGAAEGETQRSGGILGKMGLWAEGEKKAAEEAAKDADEAPTGNKSKENPTSSLGTIGEIMSSRKKGGGDSGSQ